MKVHDGNKLKLVVLVVFAVVLVGAALAYAVNPNFMFGMLRDGSTCKPGSKGCPVSSIGCSKGDLTCDGKGVVDCTKRPDLKIINVSLTSSDVNPFTTGYGRFAATVTVQNLGGATQTPIHLSFLVSELGSTVIKTGPVKNTFTCGNIQKFNISLGKINKNEFWVSRSITVDAANEISESDETNNQYFYKFKTRPTAELPRSGSGSFGPGLPISYPTYYTFSPVSSHSVYYYTITLNGSQLQSFQGNSNVYYTSPLYAKNLSYLASAMFAKISYQNASAVNWAEAAPPSMGMVLYADEFQNSTNTLTNYTNLIYIPPQGTTTPTETSVTKCEIAKSIIEKANFPLMTGNDLSFTDLPVTNSCYNFAYTMVKNGWMAGYSDGSFGVAKNLSKAEVVTIIVKAFELSLGVPPSPTFSDVPATAWYYTYVETAARYGLITAEPDGKFHPSDLASVNWFNDVLEKAVSL